LIVSCCFWGFVALFNRFGLAFFILIFFFENFEIFIKFINDFLL
jgi:hypothetical protein